MSQIKYYKYDCYWKKEKPTNFFQLKNRIGKVTENIMLFYKKQPTYNPQKYKVSHRVTNKTKAKHNSIVSGIGNEITEYKDDGTRYPNDILEFNRVKLGSALHPTQKPVELYEFLIKSFTNENEIILDFCAGSGTLAESCMNTNRRFIVIEQEEKYCEIIKNRIRQNETLF